MNASPDYVAMARLLRRDAEELSGLHRDGKADPRTIRNVGNLMQAAYRLEQSMLGVQIPLAEPYAHQHHLS